MNEYEKQAVDFLENSKTDFKVKYLKHDFYFQGDKEKRDIYKITLRRNGEQYSFNFGQSLKNSDGKTLPSAYDVLACMEKYEYLDFENFCYNCGYDEDSRKAEKIYKAVKKQSDKIMSMFSDCIEELREIN